MTESVEGSLLSERPCFVTAPARPVVLVLSRTQRSGWWRSRARDVSVRGRHNCCQKDNSSHQKFRKDVVKPSTDSTFLPYVYLRALLVIGWPEPPLTFAEIPLSGMRVNAPGADQYVFPPIRVTIADAVSGVVTKFSPQLTNQQN